MTDTLVVTPVQRLAARARVKIDLAHGRTTPAEVLRIASAAIAVGEQASDEIEDGPAQ